MTENIRSHISANREHSVFYDRFLKYKNNILQSSKNMNILLHAVDKAIMEMSVLMFLHLEMF